MGDLGIEGLLCSSIYDKRRVVARLLPPKFPTVPITLDFEIKKMFTKEIYHMSKVLSQNKHVRSEKETKKCGKMGRWVWWGKPGGGGRHGTKVAIWHGCMEGWP